MGTIEPGRGGSRLLLRPGGFVPFQRMERGETWRVLRGDAVEIHLIHPGGCHEMRVVDAGHGLRIAGGCLRAARLAADGQEAEILRCPGRGPGSSEPEVPAVSRLIREHPLHAAILRELTRCGSGA